MSDSRLYQYGRVAGFDGQTARIIFDPLGSCAACAGGCGMARVAALTGAGQRGVLLVKVGAPGELEVGDSVRVGIDARRLLRLVFMIYFLPLAGVVAGAVAASSWLPAAGDLGALSGAIVGGMVFGVSLPALTGRARSLAWLDARVIRLAR